MTLPSVLVIVVTLFFLAFERLAPGRKLPASKGWYGRALLVNGMQLLITLATVRLWIHLLGEASVFELAGWNCPVAEGSVAWLIGTFFFYWWHRLRHANGFWLIFHQLHHSPSRIEALTAFYKHPLEILSDSLLAALILYPLLGSSMMGAFWFNFFAATGEYVYHSNIQTPKWLRYFIQTPELHSVHHAHGVHRYNYSDIPLWDRLFGTYKDATEFVERCGFDGDREQRLFEMMMFKDVHKEAA